MRTWIHGVAALALVSAVNAGTAHAQQVLTFENVASCDNTAGNVGSTYAGVDFSQFTCYNWSQDPYNPSSGTNRIYANFGGTATISFANPTVFSGAFVAGYSTFGPLSFSYFLNGSLVGTSSGLVPSGTPTFLASGYSGKVDQVTVNGQSGNYILDDVTLGQATSTVPEPGTMALLGTGLVGLVPMVRRKRR